MCPRQVKNTLNRHPEAKDAGLSPHARLGTVVTGRLHGQPWKPFIDFHEAPALMRLLSAACMITIGYLSGMRPGEVLSLKAGCCPEPDADCAAPARYAIYGNVLKGVRDEEGRCIPDGKPRDLPWTVIPPVVQAIRVLERIAEGDDLFPVVTAWNNQTAHNAARKRTGHLLTAAGARDRIRSFTGYANQLAAQHDLGHRHRYRRKAPAVLTISEAQRRQTEDRIRAAADRLLRGQIPPGGGCDIQTLAIEAGVSRASLYRTYLHLKNEFEQRLARMQSDGQLPDPRAAQIARLKDDNAKLRQRVTEREQEIADLSAFKTTALSRLAAQHQEITALRAALSSRAHVRTLPGALKSTDNRQ